MGASHQPRQPFNVNISYNCLDDCKRSQVGNTTVFPIHLIWCEVGVSKELKVGKVEVDVHKRGRYLPPLDLCTP